MTDAERQRRHRKKLKREQREAETAAKRAANWARLNDPELQRKQLTIQAAWDEVQPSRPGR